MKKLDFYNLANLLILFHIMILLPPSVMGTECQGTITTEMVPCSLLLPAGANNCTLLDVSFFLNGSTFLHTSAMDFHTPFLCNATFNYSQIATYSFNYSSGDSGSIIVEEETMLRFFNLSVYVFFLGAIFTLVYFMHKFREESGTPIVYGVFAATLSFIMAAIISSGFSIIRGVTFFLDVNYYFTGLMLAFGLYSAMMSYALYKDYKVKNTPEEW